MTPLRGEAAVDDKAPALSASLQADLEAHRTAGLQAALARQPDLALRVLVQGLVMEAFYHRHGETVAWFQAFRASFAACPDIADSPARQALTAAEDAWRSRLPQEPGALWGWLLDQDGR